MTVAQVCPRPVYIFFNKEKYLTLVVILLYRIFGEIKETKTPDVETPGAKLKIYEHELKMNYG